MMSCHMILYDKMKYGTMKYEVIKYDIMKYDVMIPGVPEKWYKFSKYTQTKCSVTNEGFNMF